MAAERNADAALRRRNFVLSEMARNDFVTPAAAAAAQAQPLGLVQSRPLSYPPIAGYFMEEIRRQIIDRFGENAEDGPHSVYGGGLWVRSSLNPAYQQEAEKALRPIAGPLWRAELGQAAGADRNWRGLAGPAARAPAPAPTCPAGVAGVVLSQERNVGARRLARRQHGHPARLGRQPAGARPGRHRLLRHRAGRRGPADP